MNAQTQQETAVTQLAPRRMQLAEHAFSTWHISPEKDTPIEALLDTRYLANAVHSFPVKIGDRIVADAEDGAYTVTLYVREVGRAYCKVALLSKNEFGAAEVAPVTETDGHLLKYRGTVKRWTVTRVSDSREIKDTLQTKDEAAEWLKQHLKSMAA